MSTDPPHTGPVTVHDLRRVEWLGAAAKHQQATTQASYGQAAARAKGGCRNLGHWPAASAQHASMSRRIVALWYRACAIYAPTGTRTRMRALLWLLLLPASRPDCVAYPPAPTQCTLWFAS